MKQREISSPDKNIYVAVTCKSDNCGYNLRFEGKIKCQINTDAGKVYAYVPYSDNSDMEYEVMGTSLKDTFMKIGLEGSNKAKINILGSQINKYLCI